MRLACQIPGRRDPALVRDAPDGAGEPTAHLCPGVGRGARPDRLEQLGRYDVYFDRKLERMLNILIRLGDPARDVAYALGCHAAAVRWVSITVTAMMSKMPPVSVYFGSANSS